MYWISPSFQDDHFPRPWTRDAKIALFADRVRGWQIAIAQQVASNVVNSGYAVLSILLSYFEMFAKYEDGFVGAGQSREYFRRGAQAVLGDFFPRDPTAAAATADHLYEGVRCGLYHVGQTQGQVWLTEALQGRPVMRVNEAITINPQLLVEHVRAHFGTYVAKLLDPSESDLRARFEARFDSDAGLSSP